MPRHFFAALASLPLVACGFNSADETEENQAVTASAESESGLGYAPMSADNHADSMASDDSAYLAQAAGSGTQSSSAESTPAQVAAANIPDSEERPIMQAQVVLDRQGFGPGVIDGKMGPSTSNALEGFQEANDLEITGELDEATKRALGEWERIPATRIVTVPSSWGDITYKPVPDNPAEQAEMERLGYQSLDEKLAERFHTTVEVLKRLNPGGRPAGTDMRGERGTTGAAPAPSPTSDKETADRNTGSGSYFTAGQRLRTPNIGADRIAPGAIQERGWQQTLASLGVGSEQPDVARIVVDESEGWLKGYDSDGSLVAMFTVTTGSRNDPLPIGEWGVTGVGRNPPFSYDPELFWDVPDSREKQMLPPGPNGPVGVVWIDLTKEHYGIHGTSAPETIGRVQSHGCVRLTNWDAARLAGMISTDTEVIFQS